MQVMGSMPGTMRDAEPVVAMVEEDLVRRDGMGNDMFCEWDCTFEHRPMQWVVMADN